MEIRTIPLNSVPVGYSALADMIEDLMQCRASVASDAALWRREGSGVHRAIAIMLAGGYGVLGYQHTFVVVETLCDTPDITCGDVAITLLTAYGRPVTDVQSDRFDITDTQARVIASWHAAPALNEFVHTGAISDDTHAEISRAIAVSGDAPMRGALHALAKYAERVGPGGPVDGWDRLTRADAMTETAMRARFGMGALTR